MDTGHCIMILFLHGLVTSMAYFAHILALIYKHVESIRVGVKYSTCTWYLYLSTYLSVLDVLEYLVYRNAKVLVLVLVLDQKVLDTYK